MVSKEKDDSQDVPERREYTEEEMEAVDRVWQLIKLLMKADQRDKARNGSQSGESEGKADAPRHGGDKEDTDGRRDADRDRD